ncbi:MAG: MFS transporter, partial [Pseudomonadota bacterium]
MEGPRLWAWSGFAAVLWGAGLPIYLLAPAYYAETYGLSLTALGTVLFALRLFDVVQDPLFGWISERLRARRSTVVALAGCALGLAMVGLFAVPPPVAPLLWFAVTVTALFSAFSFLTINFYAQGVAKAQDLPGGHVRLAAWREAGALLGVCACAVAPTALAPVTDAPYAVFAWGFAAAAFLVVLAMRGEWSATSTAPSMPIRRLLTDSATRRLLLLALVNATPLAVSSTLFVFFVDAVLAAPGWEGALLVLFFLAAAASAPGWSWLAERYGARPVLLGAMVFAIVVFACVLTLGPGDVALFAVICIASGATIGADLVLLPALFARRMAALGTDGAQGFGLWAFATKFTLAFAAAVLLPLLDSAGFDPAAETVPEAALT